MKAKVISAQKLAAAAIALALAGAIATPATARHYKGQGVHRHHCAARSHCGAKRHGSCHMKHGCHAKHHYR
jgi:hypothetical protein